MIKEVAMEEITIIVHNNLNACLSQIKKYLRNDQKYLLKLVIETANLEEAKILKEVVIAFNEKNRRKRYQYIYETVCKNLDQKFTTENICNFQNNRCIAVRTCNYCENENGCCYGPKRGKCKHLKNHTCNIKSLSCKLFTCKYLRKNNQKISIKEIPLLNLFFNYKQKYIITYSIYTDEEEMLTRLLKAKKEYNQ